jgi:hypothetical protein
VKIRSPVLAGRIPAAGAVWFPRDQHDTVVPVAAAGRGEDAVGPQDGLAVAGLAREADERPDEAVAGAEAARPARRAGAAGGRRRAPRGVALHDPAEVARAGLAQTFVAAGRPGQGSVGHD